MPPSEQNLIDLRGMTAEPTTEVYTDARLTQILSKYPLLDMQGNDPYRPANTITPAVEVNPWWDPTYDLHLAAADIWDEKAGRFVNKFRFSTDGQSFDPQQQYEQAKREARSHRAQRSASSITLWPYPKLDVMPVQIGNLAEPRDPE